jgi:hypothetical protein
MIHFELIRFSGRLFHAGTLVIPYPDPGSGLLLLQAFGAIVAAILLHCRHILSRFFRHVRPSPLSSADQTDKKRPT